MWESVRGSGCRGTHFYFGATRAMKLTEEWAQKNIDRTLDGVEVVSLEETGGRRHRVVRLYVDHPDGVNHALCARVSGAMENALDSAGYMDGPYNLEVSSPGLERPLKKKVHFASHVGEKVYVKTFGPVQGQKVWRGELAEVRGGLIVVDDGSRTVEIRLEDIAKANLVFDLSLIHISEPTRLRRISYAVFCLKKKNTKKKKKKKKKNPNKQKRKKKKKKKKT